MTTTSCPHCGHQVAAKGPDCEKCGHVLMNRVILAPKKVMQKPPLPPELEGYVFEKVTPEIAALLGPINLDELLADLRAMEETGGYQLEDFIGELEEEVRRRG